MNSIETISIASLVQPTQSRSLSGAGSYRKGLRADTTGDRNVSIAADVDQRESGLVDTDARKAEEPQNNSAAKDRGQANQSKSKARGTREGSDCQECDATCALAADVEQQVAQVQQKLSKPFAEIIAQVTQITAEKQDVVVETSAEALKPALQMLDAAVPQDQFTAAQPETPVAVADEPQPVVAGNVPFNLSPVQPMPLQGEQQMLAADNVSMQTSVGVEQGEVVAASKIAVAPNEQETVAAATETEITPQLSAPAREPQAQTVDEVMTVAAGPSSSKAVEAESKPASGSEQRAAQPESDNRSVEAANDKSTTDKIDVAVTSYRNLNQAPVEQVSHDTGEAARSFEPQITGAAEADIKPLDSVNSVVPQAKPAVPQSAGAADASPAEQVAQFVRVNNLRVGQQVTVQLDPPELGRVRLSLQSDGREIRGVVEVDNPRTLGEIQREASSLMGRMADSGINVRRMDVVLNAPSQGGQHDMNSMMQDWGGRQGQDRDSYEAAGSEENLFAGEQVDDMTVLGELVTDSSINVRI